MLHAINCHRFTRFPEHISSFETIDIFYAFSDSSLEYLPSNMGAAFPNLCDLYANSCSIKMVSQENFKGLKWLLTLSLSRNQIESIDDDTFEYIPIVSSIYLGEKSDYVCNLFRFKSFHRTDNNKIKRLDGRAFASLIKLKAVDLKANKCINDSFHIFYVPPFHTIAEMSQVVTEKCGLFAGV